MPDFHLVPSPSFSPSQCVTCGTSRCDDGFVDLIAETATLGFDESGDPVHDPAGTQATFGHLYQCALCVRQAGVRAGCLDPAQAAAKDATINQLGDRIAELERELVYEREHKVVSVTDLREHLNLNQSPAPKTPAAA